MTRRVLRECSVCSGPIRRDNVHGICRRTSECVSALNAAKYDQNRNARLEKARINGVKKKYDHRAYQLKRLYKMTVADYDSLLIKQGGVCAICGRKPGKKNLSVDHDHSCCPAGGSCGNCVRGLLCRACNYYLLGQICQESKKGNRHALEVLQRAIDYVNNGGTT